MAKLKYTRRKCRVVICNLKLVLSLLNSHGSTVSTYVLNVVLTQMRINCKKKKTKFRKNKPMENLMEKSTK